MQKFGIRFPRLFGVSSLLALKDRRQSGMPEFEEAFQHFLKDELKGMAVQSLAEEEQKAVGRFQSLIEHTDANMSRKEERIEELRILEQQLRRQFAESPAPVMIKESAQELSELLYYVNQRVFYRFNDFFKEAYNPSLFAGNPAQQALNIALNEIVEMTAFDFEQEIRVTNFRLAQQIKKSLDSRFRDDTDKLRSQNPDFSFTPYEVEETAMLEPDKAFTGTDYSSVKSHYKNNKSFFERNDKEKLRDALQALMEPDANVYLEKEKRKLSEWAEFWIEQEAEGLRQHIIRQGADQIDSERTLLQQEEKLAQWKKIYSNLISERVYGMKVCIETVDTKNYRWIDVRYELGKPEAGKSLYEQEHVEGAIFWDLEKDLSDMASEAGRHPMPSDSQLEGLIRSSGLTADDKVVVYDQGGAPYAARAWWLLKYCGFDNVYISNLGFKVLKEKGAEVTAEVQEFKTSDFVPNYDTSIYADRQYVKNVIKGEELGILLDARSPERFAGLDEPFDRVPGRIPGAHNFDWSQLVHNGKFDTETDFSGVIQPHEPVVVYCGSGVTAAPLYAMLAEKGHESLRLYTGSYSDWISDAENEVEIDRGIHPEASDDDTRAILAKLIEEGYSGEMLMKKFEYEKSLLQDKQ